MKVGRELLHLARAAGADVVFVVGIGKNVGKTVTARALYEAARERGPRVGIVSAGRDGEPLDLCDAHAKPRFYLRAGTAIATARDVLPHSPASEMLASSSLATPAGPLLYVRAALDGYYELVGPPTASGVAEAVGVLRAHADVTIVDGALDRLAPIAGDAGAIVVAAGAAAAATIDEAADAVRALVRRLRVERFDPRDDAVQIAGALTASQAARLIGDGETRQVVVRDPTRIALTGKAALRAFAQLRIRCERPLRPIAATIAPIAAERAFDPRVFARAVAEATGLATFDVYAGARAA